MSGKTSLSLAISFGCYGRVAPRCGLALKKFIDVGAGVIDSDYRGKVGVILFNFGSEDLVVNMGDKIARLIFEKIKTPVIKEVDSLEGTSRGDKGFGTTGIQTINDQRTTQQEMNQSVAESVQLVSKSSAIQADQDPSKYSKMLMNEPSQHVRVPSRTAETLQIMSARQMQKLIKNDESVFLAGVRASNDFVPRGKKKKGGNNDLLAMRG